MIENIDQIKAQLDIEQVLNVIGYHKSNPINSGAEVRDYCPIHQGDNQRSLSFNVATKLGFCHSCGFEGDLIELYRNYRNTDFNEATKELATQFGIEIKFNAAKRTSFSNTNRTPLQIIEESSDNGDHIYLKEKRVVPCPGLYFGKDEKGNESIIVPFKDIEGNLQTVQFVNQYGKFFLSGYSTKGACLTIGSLTNADTVYLAEGIATAITIWMALDKKRPVVSFGSAGNLVNVVEAIKKKYLQINIIVCLDSNNAAFKQAQKIPSSYGCTYRLPSFEGIDSAKDNLADFNDLISKAKLPISVVYEQLMVEKTIGDLPIHKDEAIEVASKSDTIQLYLTEEYQEEILSYLLHNPFETIIENGLNPENFETFIFTEERKEIVEGIIKTWEQGLPVSITQVAINSHSSSPKLYETLKRLENKVIITPLQVSERLHKLRELHSDKLLRKTLAEAQASKQSPHEIIRFLRSKCDDMQSGFDTLLPQTHYLSRLVEDIKTPKYNPLATGIISFDKLIGGGFIKAELGMLAGGAGAGKTAFALQIADSVAAKGAIVIYISVEIGIAKLTERSFKRLGYVPNAQNNLSFDNVIQKYQSFANNVYLRKGRHGMLISEIRGMVLNVMRQNKGKDILLIVDPFQRLGTGNEKLDHTNETLKVSTLCSQLKEMAESLSIPILALADTTKDHKNNKEGGGTIRGSYMADHTADYVMMLRTSRDALKAIYGDQIDEKTMLVEDPFFKDVKDALEQASFKQGKYSLKIGWDKYASLVTSKVRESAKFSPLFIYRPGYHLFEDTKIWETILPSGQHIWQ